MTVSAFPYCSVLHDDQERGKTLSPARGQELRLVYFCSRVPLLAEISSALSNCPATSLNCLLQSHIGALKDRDALVNLLL